MEKDDILPSISYEVLAAPVKVTPPVVAVPAVAAVDVAVGAVVDTPGVVIISLV